MSAFLDENGKLVTVSASNPLPISNGYNLSNPMPTKDEYGSTTNGAIRDGLVYKASLTCPASSGNYSSAELYNPVGSGKVLLVLLAFGFQNVATAGRYYRHIVSTQLSNTQSDAILKTVSGQPDSVAVCQYQNISALTSNSNQHGVSSTSTTPYGQSLFQTAEQVVIKEGSGLLFEFQNTNTQINLTLIYFELDEDLF